MGAWGMDSFENDGALDWLLDLRNGQGDEAIAQALRAVLDTDDYLEVDEGQTAIAAAEVVAARNGAPSDTLPDDLVAWVQSQAAPPDPQLTTLALQAIAHIEREGSEIYELWEESDYFDEWQSVMTDLKARLARVVSG